MTKAALDAQDLMKGFSQNLSRFRFVGQDVAITPELVKVLFEHTWYHFLELISSKLQHPGPHLTNNFRHVLQCHDMLQFCLSICVFLDMPEARDAFYSQLVKLSRNTTKEEEPLVINGESVLPPGLFFLMSFFPSLYRSIFPYSDIPIFPYSDIPIFRYSHIQIFRYSLIPIFPYYIHNFTCSQIYAGAPTTTTTTSDLLGQRLRTQDPELDDPWGIIGDIHILMQDLKARAEQDLAQETLNSVLKRVHPAHLKMFDRSSVVLREGELAKKCQRRHHRTYRFLLFDDQLVYGSTTTTAETFVPHNALRLRLTRVEDIPDSLLLRHAFQILNPVKSIVVFAESLVMKQTWMRDLDLSIRSAMERNAMETRRISLRFSQEEERPDFPSSFVKEEE